MSIILLVIAFFLTTIEAHSSRLTDSLSYNVRLGYAIGGTTPLGMPAEIRQLNTYKLQPNFSLGGDVKLGLSRRWGVAAGLRLEYKSMDVDATVKNYHTQIVRGGKSLEGRFTGNNVTNAKMLMLTIPVQATLSLGSGFTLKLGPYISYLLSREFSGYVYDGYLREGDPTGPKVELGSKEEASATYDFSTDMRRLHFGLDLGADWMFCQRWGVYADVAWGLNGIFRSSFNTIEQTLYPIYGTIGITYKIR